MPLQNNDPFAASPPLPHEQLRAVVTARRITLVKLGYEPVPVLSGRKRPGMSGWQNTPILLSHDKDTITPWADQYPGALSTGIRTRFTPGCDIDVRDQDVADQIEQALLNMAPTGTILRRVGLPPKRLIPFRCAAPFKKISTSFKEADGVVHKVEVLCNGQQFVAEGIHEDTHRPYQWADNISLLNIAHEHLPLIDEIFARRFIDKADAIMERAGWTRIGSDRTNGKTGDEDIFNKTGRKKGSSIYGRTALREECEKLAAMPKDSGRNNALNGAAFNLFQLVAGGELDEEKDRVRERLFAAAEACGLVTDDGAVSVHATIESGAKAGYAQPRQANSEKDCSTDKAPPKLALTSTEFVAGFVPPDYLIGGWLQRRFVYSITAATGDGKTAIALLLTLLVSQAVKLGKLTVKRGRVLYFAGENPDDVRMRWMATTQQLGLMPEDIDNVYFIPGVFKFTEIGDRVRNEMTEHELSLVVVDTSATYFEGDDENNNMQALAHAKRLRDLSRLPGGPTVLICCHPTKNVETLIPRGGGAFLNEVDGNLTCERNDLAIELHWCGKFRGPDFAPLLFQLRLVTHERLKDTDGNLIQTVVAQSLSEAGLKDINLRNHKDQDEVLWSIDDDPELPSRERAQRLGWLLKSNEPYHMRVVRAEKALEKDRLIKKTRNGWELSERGKKEIRRLKPKDPTSTGEKDHAQH